jgi:hypothetical protein
VPTLPEVECAELEGTATGCTEVTETPTVATAEDVNVTVTTTVESDSMVDVTVEFSRGRDVLTGLAVPMVISAVPVSVGRVLGMLLFQPAELEILLPGPSPVEIGPCVQGKLGVEVTLSQGPWLLGLLVGTPRKLEMAEPDEQPTYTVVVVGLYTASSQTQDAPPTVMVDTWVVVTMEVTPGWS